jgi:hypothetical protein
MCDYSLHAIVSRPARVGEVLVSTHFRGSATLGFASPAEKNVAVCLLPGTELAFETNVRYRGGWFKSRTVNFNVAKFAKIAAEVRCQHHDALAFPTEARFWSTRWCRTNVFGSYNCPWVVTKFKQEA